MPKAGIAKNAKKTKAGRRGHPWFGEFDLPCFARFAASKADFTRSRGGRGGRTQAVTEGAWSFGLTLRALRPCVRTFPLWHGHHDSKRSRSPKSHNARSDAAAQRRKPAGHAGGVTRVWASPTPLPLVASVPIAAPPRRCAPILRRRCYGLQSLCPAQLGHRSRSTPIAALAYAATHGNAASRLFTGDPELAAILASRCSPKMAARHASLLPRARERFTELGRRSAAADRSRGPPPGPALPQGRWLRPQHSRASENPGWFR